MTARTQCRLYKCFLARMKYDRPWKDDPVIQRAALWLDPDAEQIRRGHGFKLLQGKDISTFRPDKVSLEDSAAFKNVEINTNQLEISEQIPSSGNSKLIRTSTQGIKKLIKKKTEYGNEEEEEIIFSIGDEADFSKIPMSVDKILTTEITNDTDPEIDIVNTSVLKPAFRVRGDYEFEPLEQPNEITNGSQYAIFHCATYIPNPDDYGRDVSDVNDYELVPKKWIMDHVGGQSVEVPFTFEEEVTMKDGLKVDYITYQNTPTTGTPSIEIDTPTLIVDNSYTTDYPTSTVTLNTTNVNVGGSDTTTTNINGDSVSVNCDDFEIVPNTTNAAISMDAKNIDIGGSFASAIKILAPNIIIRGNGETSSNIHIGDNDQTSAIAIGHSGCTVHLYGTVTGTAITGDASDNQFVTWKYIKDHIGTLDIPYTFDDEVTFNDVTTFNDVAIFNAGMDVDGIMYALDPDQDEDPEEDPDSGQRVATHQYVLDHGGGGEGPYLSLTHTSKETVTGPTTIQNTNFITGDLYKTSQNDVFTINSSQYMYYKEGSQYTTPNPGNTVIWGTLQTPPTTGELQYGRRLMYFKANYLFPNLYDFTYDYYLTSTISNQGSWFSLGAETEPTYYPGVIPGQCSIQFFTPVDPKLFERPGSTCFYYFVDTEKVPHNGILFGTLQLFNSSPHLEDESYGVNVKMPTPLRVVYRRKIFRMDGEYFLTQGTWLQFDDFTERVQDIYETPLSTEDIQMLIDKNITIDDYEPYRKLSLLERNRLIDYLNLLEKSKAVIEKREPKLMPNEK